MQIGAFERGHGCRRGGLGSFGLRRRRGGHGGRGRRGILPFKAPHIQLPLKTFVFCVGKIQGENVRFEPDGIMDFQPWLVGDPRNNPLKLLGRGIVEQLMQFPRKRQRTARCRRFGGGGGTGCR